VRALPQPGDHLRRTSESRPLLPVACGRGKASVLAVVCSRRGFTLHPERPMQSPIPDQIQRGRIARSSGCAFRRGCQAALLRRQGREDTPLRHHGSRQRGCRKLALQITCAARRGNGATVVGDQQGDLFEGVAPSDPSDRARSAPGYAGPLRTVGCPRCRSAGLVAQEIGRPFQIDGDTHFFRRSWQAAVAVYRQSIPPPMCSVNRPCNRCSPSPAHPENAGRAVWRPTRLLRQNTPRSARDHANRRIFPFLNVTLA